MSESKCPSSYQPIILLSIILPATVRIQIFHVLSVSEMEASLPFQPWRGIARETPGDGEEDPLNKWQTSQPRRPL